ncbi:MAG: hypothetical protein RJA19_700 [Bacteroidota bacterium]
MSRASESPRPLLCAVIIAFNEEANIGRCLDSLVGVVDEVWVVDSGSTDATVELARARGAHVLYHPFEGHIEQKNWAWEQSTAEWILSLDADEALDDRLRASILSWRGDEVLRNSAEGIVFNRLTEYCGHWVRHSGWYPDRKLRLWRRGWGAWGGENPHDRLMLRPEGRVARLSGDLLHYSYASIDDHLRQLAYFSDIAAVAHVARGGVAYGWGIRILKAGFQWTKNWVLRGGWRDGWAGWQIARYSALATWEKYRKIKDLDGVRRSGVERVKRVLVCRTDGLGDVLLSLPIARWLKENTEVEVSFCVAPYAVDVAAACPDVDHVVPWTGEGAAWGGRYDLAVVAFPDKSVVRALREAGIPIRVGTWRRLHTWGSLTHGSWRSRKKSGWHEAWHGLELLESVRLAPGMARPGKALPDPGAVQGAGWVRLNAGALPEGVADLFQPGRKRVVLHPGSHGSAGNWDLERYRALADALISRGWDVLVTGTAREREGMGLLFSEEETAPGHGTVVDVTGRLTVAGLIALLARVDAVVAASTGPLHLAAALGTPVVGLYGDWAPVWPERWHPLGPHAHWKVTGIHTASGGLDIPVADVLQAVEAIIASSQPASASLAQRSVDR